MIIGLGMSTIGAIFINAENLINNLIFNSGAKKNKEEPYSVELVRNKATSDIKASTWICGELIKNTKVKLNEETYKINFGSRGHANFTYDQKQRVEKDRRSIQGKLLQSGKRLPPNHCRRLLR